MRTTLDLDDDVLAFARELAHAEGRSIGAVVSELARRGATPSRVELDGKFPVVHAPAGSAVITPAMVERALEDA